MSDLTNYLQFCQSQGFAYTDAQMATIKGLIKDISVDPKDAYELGIKNKWEPNEFISRLMYVRDQSNTVKANPTPAVIVTPAPAPASKPAVVTPPPASQPASEVKQEEKQGRFSGIKKIWPFGRKTKTAQSNPGNGNGKPGKGSAKDVVGKYGKWIGLGLVVLILLGGLYFLTLNYGVSMPQVASAPSFEEAPEVRLSAIDVKNVEFIGSKLILMIIALMALIPLGVLDGRERLQVSDVIVAIVGVNLNYVLLWKPIIAFSLELLPMYNEQSISILFGVLITSIVITKAVTGGRDTTNLGVYFGMLAIAGGITGHMGAFQAAFNTPSQPVYLLEQIPSAIVALRYEEVRYSVLVYGVLFLGIASYLLDILYPREKDVRWEAIGTAAVTVGAYFLALQKFEAPYALILAIAAGVILAVVTRKTGGKLQIGENPLAKVVQRVFDYTAWDGVSLGVLVIVVLQLI